MFPVSSFAEAGGGSTGGGSEYVVDFVTTANQVVYPWLKLNGHKLRPQVDADQFLTATNPRDIIVIDRVYESCDGSKNGREVSACYSAEEDKFYLSRLTYPLLASQSVKVGLVAHEVFRKMGIEGDDYEISKQMPISVHYESQFRRVKITLKSPEADWRLDSLPKGSIIILRNSIDLPPAVDNVGLGNNKTNQLPMDSGVCVLENTFSKSQSEIIRFAENEELILDSVLEPFLDIEQSITTLKVKTANLYIQQLFVDLKIVCKGPAKLQRGNVVHFGVVRDLLNVVDIYLNERR